MEHAKTLIRTVVRTFYETRQILIIDALCIHSVLDASDLAYLLSSHPKEIRKYINPLKTARLLASHTRVEAKVGSSSNRGIQHEYYYIPFHPAIDAIKYKIMRLKREVEQKYKQDETKKDWRCPHCKAEYEELEVLDSVGEEGFLCHRCGHVLEQTEEAAVPSGNHEKIRRLNTQLQPFETIIQKIDVTEVPENTFFEAWERKKDVPKPAGTGQTTKEYIALSGRGDVRGRGPDQTDANALSINLTSGAELDKEEAAKKEARRQELAKQNQLPAWHTSSAIKPPGSGADAPVKSETDAPATITSTATGNGTLPSFLKTEPHDEKKPDVTMQSELDAYVLEMEREKEEEERKRAMEDVDDNSADDFEDDFEDVVSTGAMGTPSSKNGVKRELDSAESSNANTPASSSDVALRDVKRVKFEQEQPQPHLAPADSDDDDEGDFEDAM